MEKLLRAIAVACALTFTAWGVAAVLALGSDALHLAPWWVPTFLRVGMFAVFVFVFARRATGRLPHSKPWWFFTSILTASWALDPPLAALRGPVMTVTNLVTSAFCLLAFVLERSDSDAAQPAVAADGAAHRR